MAFNWQELEDAQFEFTCAQLEALAQQPSTDEFYAFALCCNAPYGEALLSLNSEQHHLQTVKDTYPHLGAAELKHLRWSIGDWQFMQDNLSTQPTKATEASSERRETAISLYLEHREMLDRRLEEAEELDDEELAEDAEEELSRAESDFVLCMCRTALRLEENRAFQALRTTSDFTVYTIDHDETQLESWQRFVRERINCMPPWNSPPWPIHGEHQTMAAAILAESAIYREEQKLSEAAHLLREGIARLPNLGSTAEHTVGGTDVQLTVPENVAWARAYVAYADSLGYWEKELQQPLLRIAEDFDGEYAEIYYVRAKYIVGYSQEADQLTFAAEQLDRAIQLEPNEPRYHGLRGDIEMEPSKNGYRDAVSNFTRALELDPHNKNWLRKRAEANVKLGNLAATVEDYQQIATLQNHRIHWSTEHNRVRCAELLMQLENFQAAIEEWSRWVDHYQRDYRTHPFLLRRAECYRALGNEEAATADEAYVAQHGDPQ